MEDFMFGKGNMKEFLYDSFYFFFEIGVEDIWGVGEGVE